MKPAEFYKNRFDEKGVIPEYAKPFVKSHGRARAGQQFSRTEALADGVHSLVREMYKLAKRRKGWTWSQICFYLRLGGTAHTTIMKTTPNKLIKGKATDMRYDQFMGMAKLAGVPTAIAVVLWAKANIPDEYAEDRDLIGLATKTWAPDKFWRVSEDEAEAREIIDTFHEAVPHGAKVVPNELSKVRPGMQLISPKRKLWGGGK